MKVVTFPTLAAFTALAATASAQSPESKVTLASEAETFHRANLQASEGVVLGRLEDTSREFAAAGAIRQGDPKPKPETLFEIGSITKVFTAILLADAVVRGKAELDDPIADHLPQAVRERLDEHSPIRSITLVELATHTSGLPRLDMAMLEKGDTTNPYAAYTVADLYAYLTAFQRDDLETPGEYAYSNLGFALLGTLVTRIHSAGEDDSPAAYATILRERILDPLGMDGTHVLLSLEGLPADARGRLASGHHAGNRVPHWTFQAFAGAGAMVSSAEDLLTFAEAHWAEQTPRELEAALALAQRKHVEDQGLGWHFADDKLTHGGGTGGFRSELTVAVDRRRANVSLRNSAGPALKESTATGEFGPIAGFWEGTLDVSPKIKLRLIYRITSDGGVYQYSLDQGGTSLPASKTRIEDGEAGVRHVTFTFPTVEGAFNASLSDDGNRLEGSWTQGRKMPLILTRYQGTDSDSVPPALRKLFEKAVVGEPKALSTLAGYWSGYLGGRNPGQGLFLILEFEEIAKGLLEPKLFSPDQHPLPIPISRLELKGGGKTLRIESKLIKAHFEGSRGSNEDLRFEGNWSQQQEIPLTLVWSADRPKREP